MIPPAAHHPPVPDLPGAAPASFTLDRFQVEAIAAIDAGQSVLVAAPTGSGKTVVAEHAVAVALGAGRKAFYTTPIKALSNQKFADLVALHGRGQVGLLTGDNVVNGDAPIVVMTTEVLRNMIYASSPALTGLAVVVLDEVHYLQDPYRGPVWEEVIIHAPPDVRLVCLSATVSNADELAEWISEVRGPTATVVEERRPVELVNQYAAHDKATRQLVVVPTLVDGRPNPMGERFDGGTLKPTSRQHGRPRRRFATPRRIEMVELLGSQELLPAITFVFSRAGCDEAAAGLLDAGLRLTTPSERQEIRAIAEDRVAELDPADLRVLGYDRWLAALEQGIAAHHAGMVPPFKEAVEACFVRGLVKIVYATETLALGVNMPARSVVIEALSKFTGDHHELLTAGEYTQLTGRAGRRGIDEVGRAIVLWSPFTTFDQVAGLAMSRHFALRSSFRPTYNMTANLIRRYDREGAHRLLNRSFAQFQADRSVVKLEGRRTTRQATLDRLRPEATCERGDVEQYRAVLRADEAQRNGTSHLADLRHAMSRLRPGDVITTGGGQVVVLSVAHRGPDALRLQVTSAKGRTRTLTTGDFDGPPKAIARVNLPAPYQPGDPGFQADAARALRRVQVKAPPTRRARPTRIRSLADEHPVASCPDRAAHLRAAVQVERLTRELADLDERMGGSAGSIARRFDDVLGLLAGWGFTDGWALTAKGRLLVRIYHECDLVVAEALSRGLFDGLDAPELAALASCFTYEHRSRTPPPPPWFPSGRMREAFTAAERIGRDLQAAERRANLPETRLPDPTFVPMAQAWAAGTGLDDVLDDEELSGGDFVRNIRQLLDLLRQIGDTAPLDATRATAHEATDRLFRGVIAASSVLGGTGPGDDEPDDLLDEPDATAP